MSRPRVDRSRGVGAVIAVIVVLFVIFVPDYVTVGSLFVWESAVAAIVFATSTNLLFGATGLPSFGQAAFYGAGAYTVGMLAPHGWNVVLALLAAIGVSAALALGTALFAWRARGLVYAMLTLAVAQALYTLVVQVDTFGSENGLYGITPTSLFGINLTSAVNLWYFIVICAAIGVLVLWLVWRSPFGRTLNAIREDGVRATYLGIDVRRSRAGVFVLAGAVAGLAGALFAYTNQVATPDELYWSQSAIPIIMLLVGGLNYFWGPAVGAVLLTWFLHFLSDQTTNSNIYLGAILLLVLALLPHGLLSLPGRIRRLRHRRGAVDAAAQDPDGSSVVSLLGVSAQGGGEGTGS